MSGPHAPRVILTPPSGRGLGDGLPDLAAHGTGTSVPGGIECVFMFNNLYLNNRNVIDKYRITSISGLDDPDLRDSREDNPAYEGETVYSSLHGGRTIVLNGRIEAFSLKKLRDMQQALRTAFNDISKEHKLYFLTGAATTDHYIMCKKFQKIQFDEAQTKDNFFRDFQVTLRASNPRFLRNRRKNPQINYDEEGITLINEGNYAAEPVIRLTGSLANIEFQNTSVVNRDGSYETFKLKSNVTIGTGEHIIIDIAKNTIKDSNGDNRFNDLAFDSDWPRIYPGGNAIYLPEGKMTSANSDGTITFTYRDTWI